MPEATSSTYLYCKRCGFSHAAGAVAPPKCPDCGAGLRIWEDVGDGPPPGSCAHCIAGSARAKSGARWVHVVPFGGPTRGARVVECPEGPPA